MSEGLSQYPCALAVAGEHVYVGLSSLTGEQWNGSVSVFSSSSSSSSSVVSLRHGVSSLAALDSSLLFAASDGPQLHVLRAHGLALKEEAALAGHHAPVCAVAKCRKDEIVSSSRDMASIVWDAATQSVLQIVDVHETPLALNAATQEGHFASYSPDDRHLKIFKVGDSKATHSLTTPTEATALTFHGPHSVLVGLYGGGSLQYDLRNLSNPPLQQPAKRHAAAVRALLVLGDCVVSGSDDGTVRFSDSDRVIQHADFVRALAVAGGGKQLVTASWDKTVKFHAL